MAHGQYLQPPDLWVRLYNSSLQPSSCPSWYQIKQKQVLSEPYWGCRFETKYMLLFYLMKVWGFCYSAMDNQNTRPFLFFPTSPLQCIIENSASCGKNNSLFPGQNWSLPPHFVHIIEAPPLGSLLKQKSGNHWRRSFPYPRQPIYHQSCSNYLQNVPLRWPSLIASPITSCNHHHLIMSTGVQQPS